MVYRGYLGIMETKTRAIILVMTHTNTAELFHSFGPLLAVVVSLLSDLESHLHDLSLGLLDV